MTDASVVFIAPHMSMHSSNVPESFVTRRQWTFPLEVTDDAGVQAVPQVFGVVKKRIKMLTHIIFN